MTDNVDNFLAHYGVKGMKWGVTRSTYKGMSKSERKAQKTKNIEGARKRIGSGENRTKYLKAKANVSVAKAQLKKAEASRSSEEIISKRKEGLEASKKVLRSVKDKNADDYRSAYSTKNGKELATSLLLGAYGDMINISRDLDRMALKS